MKILFAAPDRDLVECYGEILRSDFGETVTAFDGAQVLSLIPAEHFDIAVVDGELPRVGYKTLIERIIAAGIPVAVLEDGPVSARRLAEEPVPSAFLSYPFSPDELGNVIRSVTEKAGSGEKIEVPGAVIDVRGFRIEGGPRITSGEIDLLLGLLKSGRAAPCDGALVGSLNSKFSAAGVGTRIRYFPGKGFGTVTENEKS